MKSLKMTTIKSYYQNGYQPWVPSSIKFRMILLLDEEGVARKHSVRNGAQLKELLIKENPYQAYYRTSLFLNPVKVKKKNKQDKFLRQDLVFDVDAPTLFQAKEETQKLLDWLSANDYPTPQLAYSGSKGFHVFISEHYKISEQETAEDEHKILEALKQEGIAVDTSVTANTRGVIGLPNTVHGETGNKREIIKLTDLWSFEPTQVAPGRRKPMIGRQPRTKQRADADAGATPCPELGSSILGTKGRHVFFMAFDRKPNLDKLREKYNLPHLYLFQTPSGYSAASLKAMPLEQLNYKWKQSWLPLDAKLVSFEEYDRYSAIVSRGHFLAFFKLKYPLPYPKGYCGSSSTKLFKVKK